MQIRERENIRKFVQSSPRIGHSTGPKFGLRPFCKIALTTVKSYSCRREERRVSILIIVNATPYISNKYSGHNTSIGIIRIFCFNVIIQEICDFKGAKIIQESNSIFGVHHLKVKQESLCIPMYKNI